MKTIKLTQRLTESLRPVNEAFKSPVLASIFRVADNKAQDAIRVLYNTYGIALSEIPNDAIEGFDADSNTLKRRMNKALEQKVAYATIVLHVKGSYDPKNFDCYGIKIKSLEDVILLDSQGTWELKYAKDSSHRSYKDVIAQYNNDYTSMKGDYMSRLLILTPKQSTMVFNIDNTKLQKELKLVYDREIAGKKKEDQAKYDELLKSTKTAVKSIVGFEPVDGGYSAWNDLKSLKVSPTGNFAEYFDVDVKVSDVWGKATDKPYIRISKGGSGFFNPVKEPGQSKSVIAYGLFCEAITRNDHNIVKIINNALEADAIAASYDDIEIEHNGIMYIRSYSGKFETSPNQKEKK